MVNHEVHPHSVGQHPILSLNCHAHHQLNQHLMHPTLLSSQPFNSTQRITQKNNCPNNNTLEISQSSLTETTRKCNMRFFHALLVTYLGAAHARLSSHKVRLPLYQPFLMCPQPQFSFFFFSNKHKREGAIFNQKASSLPRRRLPSNP